jgi:aspartate 1-decarboxylase
MVVHILKSKIHRARVTGGDADYEGSLSIDPDLMQKVEMFPFERILCSNISNAARFETYAIPGKRGQIVLNGAAAHMGKTGDRLIIMSFTEVEAAQAAAWKPRIVVVDEQNRIIDERGL